LFFGRKALRRAPSRPVRWRESDLAASILEEVRRLVVAVISVTEDFRHLPDVGLAVVVGHIGPGRPVLMSFVIDFLVRKNTGHRPENQ